MTKPSGSWMLFFSKDQPKIVPAGGHPMDRNCCPLRDVYGGYKSPKQLFSGMILQTRQQSWEFGWIPESFVVVGSPKSILKIFWFLMIFKTQDPSRVSEEKKTMCLKFEPKIDPSTKTTKHLPWSTLSPWNPRSQQGIIWLCVAGWICEVRWMFLFKWCSSSQTMFVCTGWWFEPLWKIWKSVGMMTFPIFLGK